jgi:hypothetical protein
MDGRPLLQANHVVQFRHMATAMADHSVAEGRRPSLLSEFIGLGLPVGVQNLVPVIVCLVRQGDYGLLHTLMQTVSADESMHVNADDWLRLADDVLCQTCRERRPSLNLARTVFTTLGLFLYWVYVHVTCVVPPNQAAPWAALLDQPHSYGLVGTSQSEEALHLLRCVVLWAMPLFFTDV